MKDEGTVGAPTCFLNIAILKNIALFERFRFAKIFQ
jgi:hypothetical protein